MKDNELKLFYMNIDSKIAPEKIEHLLQTVSPKKREQINRYRFEADKKRSLFAELLLHYLCRKMFGIQKEEFHTVNNKYGKPYFKNDSSSDTKEIPFFNISHSGKYVLCGISLRECGVDIEEIKSYPKDVARHGFCEEEYAALENAAEEEKDKLFYTYWTLKESTVKYLGKGLSVPLKSFCLRRKSDGDYEIDSSDDQIRNTVAFSRKLDDGYMIAAVCEKGIDSITCEEIDIADCLS